VTLIPWIMARVESMISDTIDITIGLYLTRFAIRGHRLAKGFA